MQTSEEFNKEVRPLLDKLPNKHLDIIRAALFVASGHEESSPDVEDYFDEAKDLLLYLTEPPCKREKESVTSKTDEGDENERN